MELALTTQLSTIPELISYGETTLSSFRGQISQEIADGLALNVSALTDVALAEFDTKMANIQTRASKGKDHVAAKRMPITRVWNDSILKRFTSVESQFDAIGVQALTIRKSIAAEIEARRQKLQMSTELKKNRDQERIYYLGALNNHLIEAAKNYVQVKSKNIVERFFAFTEVEKLERFVKSLTDWTGAFSDQEKHDLMNGFSFGWQYHNTKEEPAPVATQDEFNDIISGVNSMYFILVATTRDTLVQYAPERLLELKSGVTVPDSDIKKRIEQFTAAKADESAKIASAAVRADTAANNVTAAVVQAETMGAGAKHAKGVKTKKKLVPATHAHWESIIRHYIDLNFAHLSIAEIEKKFAFMLKSVETNSNSTNQWPLGVPTEDDFSIRRQSSK